MKCLWCGNDFAPGTVTQKYCSIKCRQTYLAKHRKDSKDERERAYPARSFQCACCGTRVSIVAGNARDMRTKFCSHQCEKRFWRHPTGKRVPSNNRMQTYRSFSEYTRYEQETNERENA